jgi:hypothetical protein
MDPITIATAAVSLLVPFFQRLGGRLAERVGEDLGDAAMRKLDRLYEAVRGHLAGNRVASSALETVKEQPDSERDQGALQLALAQAVESDPSFGQTLATLIEDVKAAGGPTITWVSDAGAVAIGGNVEMRGTNVAARDMTISGGQQIKPDGT